MGIPLDTAAPYLELQVSSKSFPVKGTNRQILKNISLKMTRGSFTTLLGPSGCGKTTLLRIASGLDTDFQGSVKLHQKTITNTDKKCFGFVFQDSNLLPWKNVEENISFFCKLLNKDCDVNQLIQDVGLQGFERAYPQELSGGMQKRVSLARALATEPKILFMDEPFSSLDEFTRRKMNDLLLNIWEKHKTTIFFVTHNIDEALMLSDHIIILTDQPTAVKTIYETDQLTRPRTNDIRKNTKYLDLLDKILKDFNL
jgi:ABC-type nitrate/sulfonate/bicarbonate transport system ATPase subunit